MLTAIPPQISDDERALLAVVKQMRRFDWDRFLLGWCAGFHALIAFTCAFAPWTQLQTQGTQPVFDIASRYIWAGVFAAVAFGLLVSQYVTARWVRGLSWLAVLFLGGMWLTAFSLAVLRGEGSAIGVVIWPFLYGPWALVAFRSLRKR